MDVHSLGVLYCLVSAILLKPSCVVEEPSGNGLLYA